MAKNIVSLLLKLINNMYTVYMVYIRYTAVTTCHIVHTVYLLYSPVVPNTINYYIFLYDVATYVLVLATVYDMCTYWLMSVHYLIVVGRGPDATVYGAM